jgi:POT family proton-dependent oligopeptide transporter
MEAPASPRAGPAPIRRFSATASRGGRPIGNPGQRFRLECADPTTTRRAPMAKAAPTETAPDPTGQGKMPSQIPYIIGNEGCERFSFYGMRNVLTPFLVSSMLLYLPEADRPAVAKDVFHTFVIGVYFFPLLGGWLADRFLGKYRTIFWLSLVYCVGQACLATFYDNRMGFYFGLFLIALGSGGIKPCVSAFVGDQFDKTNRHLAQIVYDAFYWIINFGSFFASLLVPYFLKEHGPAWAFGIPGVLMAISTVILWLGRKKYVMVPPSPPNPHSFLNVAKAALFSGEKGPGTGIAVLGFVLALAAFAAIPTLGFVASACTALVVILTFGGIGTWMQLEQARGKHPDEAVDGVRAVLRLLVIFALITPFWSLFDQKASTWVLQAGGMAKPDWFQPAQMQALNPALVMILIPFNNLVLYPALRKIGWNPTPLKRMTAGIAFSGVAWVIAGGLQLWLDAGDVVQITWQILPYIFLTMGEVLVSATGLEFAYSQAPAAMKGVLMSFFNLSVTVGNLWVLLVNASVKNPAVTDKIASASGLSTNAFLMFFFAGFAFAATLAFAFFARRYPVVDHYRPAT